GQRSSQVRTKSSGLSLRTYLGYERNDKRSRFANLRSRMLSNGISAPSGLQCAHESMSFSASLTSQRLRVLPSDLPVTARKSLWSIFLPAQSQRMGGPNFSTCMCHGLGDGVPNLLVSKIIRSTKRRSGNPSENTLKWSPYSPGVFKTGDRGYA